MHDDIRHIELIRQTLPAVEKFIYMNTGGVGPLPVSTLKAIEEAQQNELNNGRIGADAYLNKRKIKLETKELLAEFFHAEADEIALTHNTTEGINLIISAFDWHRGEEIVTTNAEHGAILLPLFLVQQRYGVVIRTANLEENPVKAVQEQISAKTRLIAVSHVSFSSGELLPVAEIVQLAHRHGIPVLVDGAQSAGAIPIDFKELDIDYYSLPGQKWLCGPEGTGALYVKKENLADLKQTFIGLSSVEEFHIERGFRLPDSARRFEISSTYIPSAIGLKSSIQWLTKIVGREWAYARIKELGRIAGSELAAIKGVTVVTPGNRTAGLISFRADGVEPARLVEFLAGRGIIIRRISELDCVRAAISFFNTEEEVEKLVKAIASVE
jgi:L-cysteine/cystine lyase